MAGVKYSVSRGFKTKAEAEKWVKKVRKDGYGAKLRKSSIDPPYKYQVRRSDFPIRQKKK